MNNHQKPFLENGLPNTNVLSNFDRSIDCEKMLSKNDKSLNFKEIYENLSVGMDVHKYFSYESFEKETKAILTQIQNDDKNSDLLNNFCLPFAIPKLAYEDPGESMESFCIPKLEFNFKKKFKNNNTHELSDRLTDSKNSKYDLFLERNFDGPIIGCIFPCIKNLKIFEAVEFVSKLPNNYILSGSLDLVSALIGNPKFLEKNDDIKIWMSGITSETSGTGFNLYLKNRIIEFNREHHGKEVNKNFICCITVLLN